MTLTVVDMHTGGEPLRIVTGGVLASEPASGRFAPVFDSGSA